jgi:hypothetical protein
MGPNRPPFNEAEYWRDFEIIRNNVNAAMVSCYTHRALTHAAASEPKILAKVNQHGEYWRITFFSLQSALFIVLSRILDHDDRVHSIHHLLNATTAHPEFFSKDALRARKLRTLGNEPNPPWLNEYVQAAWEPNTQDLRALKKALAPHKAKFDAIYLPIRHQIAHIIFKDEEDIRALYSKTLKTDIDELLRFLHSLVHAIQDLAWNGRKPDLTGNDYGYAGRVREISSQAEAILHALP